MSSKRIDFGVLSAQDFKQLSVLEVHQRNLFDINAHNRPPAAYGVLDRRMVLLLLIG